MALLLSVYKSSLGKACCHFICDILLGSWASRGREEGELDSLEATVHVWHWESEMAKGKKKPSFSESVALNDLTWQWETRKACNAGAPVAVWLTVTRTFSFIALLSLNKCFFWELVPFWFNFDSNVHLDGRAYTSLGILLCDFCILG